MNLAKKHVLLIQQTLQLRFGNFSFGDLLLQLTIGPGQFCRALADLPFKLVVEYL